MTSPGHDALCLCPQWRARASSSVVVRVPAPWLQAHPKIPALAALSYCEECCELTGQCDAATIAVALYTTGLVVVPDWLHPCTRVGAERWRVRRRPSNRDRRGIPPTRQDSRRPRHSQNARAPATRSQCNKVIATYL